MSNCEFDKLSFFFYTQGEHGDPGQNGGDGPKGIRGGGVCIIINNPLHIMIPFSDWLGCSLLACPDVLQGNAGRQGEQGAPGEGGATGHKVCKLQYFCLCHMNKNVI